MEHEFTRGIATFDSIALIVIYCNLCYYVAAVFLNTETLTFSHYIDLLRTISKSFSHISHISHVL